MIPLTPEAIAAWREESRVKRLRTAAFRAAFLRLSAAGWTPQDGELLVWTRPLDIGELTLTLRIGAWDDPEAIQPPEVTP